LFALNGALLEERARRLAARVIQARSTDPDRCEHLHELAWSRPPTSEEMARHRMWLARASAAVRDAGVPGERRELEVWTSSARVMLMANEFLYVD
jgi:hypothetical protein